MKKYNRKHTRFNANFEGKYRIIKSPQWDKCHIYDISPNGLKLKVNQPLFVDDIIEISLDIDNKKELIEAKVIHSLGQIAGVEFRSDKAKDIIDSAIERAFTMSRTPKKTYDNE